ncbi:MAG TPA: beta-L-arabinofuranosidase domain-containing protein, partial [Bryobacteraceae bacterium]|nr:beta-L-arabinofuranosidase domain-containing protein [Bryobacteraceae bacterium]
MQIVTKWIVVLVGMSAFNWLSPAQTFEPPVPNRAPLQANAFNPLPLGAVRPLGWLLRQEQIQGSGLTGHLDEFWNDVGPNSGWLGGTGESWERGPYYLDGLLPLAYQLGDPTLIAKAKKWIEWTLNSQQANGQFGPVKNNDWWPRMVMLKALTQYQEVTGDPRVIPFMTRYFQFELKELPGRPLKDWGKYRWQDNAYTVLWLYNRTGDKQLLQLARLLHQQGYNWEAQFANFQYTAKQSREKLGLGEHNPLPDIAMQTHGVNNAMALKTAPVWWLVTGAVSDQTALYRQLAMLDKYHGLPNGMFSADEHFAGLDPSQGTELCAVVESMFSYEQAFAILGDSQLADRLERVSYNALPATLSTDMWSHQYDQQPNQIACTRAHRQWSTNGADSNLFGLEPNFGCCTANLHQGWPKLVSNLWMATPDDGLVTVAYSPSEVRARLAGKDISITEDTEYPFRGAVRLTVHTGS